MSERKYFYYYIFSFVCCSQELPWQYIVIVIVCYLIVIWMLLSRFTLDNIIGKNNETIMKMKICRNLFVLCTRYDYYYYAIFHSILFIYNIWYGATYISHANAHFSSFPLSYLLSFAFLFFHLNKVLLFDSVCDDILCANIKSNFIYFLTA